MAHSERPPAVFAVNAPRRLAGRQGERDAGRGVAPVRQAAVRGGRQEASELRPGRAVTGQDLRVEKIRHGHGQVGPQRFLQAAQNRLILTAEKRSYRLQAGRLDGVGD